MLKKKANESITKLYGTEFKYNNDGAILQYLHKIM